MAPIFEIKFEITLNFFSKLSFQNKIQNNRFEIPVFEIPVFEIVSFEINLSYRYFVYQMWDKWIKKARPLYRTILNETT